MSNTTLSLTKFAECIEDIRKASYQEGVKDTKDKLIPLLKQAKDALTVQVALVEGETVHPRRVGDVDQRGGRKMTRRTSTRLTGPGITIADSPVEVRSKELPRGDGNWPGYDKVYHVLQNAAEHLAIGQHTRLGQDHVDIMAALGSGHEETMKYYALLAQTYHWA